ncbi:MAG: hypothetical protein KAZ30_03515, partial [Candidatus Magasanikbacteria bacterium]|nr:hypothetical protein [Candidatus Magasanikbacteria bacterium]
SDGSFYSNMLLEPGGTLYNHDFNMVKVYGVRDMETGEELDVVPPAIACINYDSILVTGVLDADGVLTCQ